MPANNSFKPNFASLHQSHGQKACHGFGSTTQVGLTQALDRMKTIPLLALLAFVGSGGIAHASDSSPCPRLINDPSVKWENTRSAEYWLCHAKDTSGTTIIKAMVASHPGVATYGFNFHSVTRTNGRDIVWFSDRDQHGENKSIARTFFSSGVSEFPVTMVWFEFSDQADFNRKADLVAQLDVAR